MIKNLKKTEMLSKILGLILLISILSFCKSKKDEGAPSNTRPAPVATAQGTAVGSPATMSIGLAGGTLISPDSAMTLIIPAGALSAETVINIQQITNNAHGGFGNGYRLTPDGLTFQKPINLIFTYTGQDLSGTSVKALDIAFQTADGYWQLTDTLTLDTTAKTVATTTTHFSDWSFVETFRINPSSKSIFISKATYLQVEVCYGIEGDKDPVLGYSWVKIFWDLADEILSNWSVNGIPGGNSTVGTILYDLDGGDYFAPATIPTPNTVEVSVNLLDKYRHYGKVLLISNITILGEDYIGTVQFTMSSGVSGTAHVKWTKFEDLGDTKRYLPSGYIDCDINSPDCLPLHLTNFPIKTGTAANPEGTLVVFTSKNKLYPNQYFFGITADGNITLYCGSPNYPPITVAADQIINFTGGVCGAPPYATFTDEKVLTGTTVCPLTGVQSMSWAFTAK